MNDLSTITRRLSEYLVVNMWYLHVWRTSTVCACRLTDSNLFSLQIAKLKQQLQQRSKPAVSGGHDKDRQRGYAHGSCSLGASQVPLHQHTAQFIHMCVHVFEEAKLTKTTEPKYFYLISVTHLDVYPWNHMRYYWLHSSVNKQCCSSQEVKEIKHWSNRKATASHSFCFSAQLSCFIVPSSAAEEVSVWHVDEAVCQPDFVRVDFLNSGVILEHVAFNT